ncbi:sulfite exporter TauE/SafE family protein [Variovorax terrae]|uniref:Probable membrane transporter protein n=1 Tax=Variovorax terrae TaxID=2923278 RepID=A0A9X1VYC5_9BURK|nr:sulfite exporter TauE/SafE family protein [Variovorax terrae]MCJ0765732.1 sulfite exporter TauE/SafE family protein [Variovorax terrae]
MPAASVHEFVMVSFIFLLAGGVKGLLGMGLPTVAMGLLGLVMPVAEGAALLFLPSLLTNLWQMARGGRLRALAWRLWPMMAGVCAGVWAGHGWMAGPAGHALRLLGLCLVAYALSGLAGWRLPRPAPRLEAAASVAVGGLTGLLTAATGVFVLPAVPYLQALGLEKDEMAQALGLSFTVSTLALAVNLAASQHLNLVSALQSLLVLLPALVGMGLGQRLRDELSQEGFRRWLMWGLLVLGGWLVWQAP